jgi:hypothetical protein
MNALRDLILVAGHAAFRRDVSLVPEHPEHDEWWTLESFQRGEPRFYIEHIRRGVELARAARESLLLFSGGHTRKESSAWSEARTYRAIAEQHRFWIPDALDASSVPEVTSLRADLARRIGVEEFARDSYENVLFGLCRFRQLTGRAPRRVTVVSWTFKAERFDRHRAAIRFPAERFSFEGVGQPVDLESSLRGERKTLASFDELPHGTGGDALAKRTARTFGSRAHGYERCPGLDEFIDALESLEPCRPDFPGDVAWQ